MDLDEFTGRNRKRTEFVDAQGKHWIVRTDPVFRDCKLVCYETVLLLQLDYCNKKYGCMKHDGFVARLQRAEAMAANGGKEEK